MAIVIMSHAIVPFFLLLDYSYTLIYILFP
jgi:hypothetical protein